MHLSFIYLMDLDLEESITFFGDLFSNWLPHSFYHHRKLSNQEHQEKSLETIDAFEENFDKQKDALIPFLNTLWSSLEAGDLFDDDAFNEWIAFCKLFKSEMNHMINSRRVIDRTDKYVFNSKKPLSKKQTLLHGLFSDYIHMTNNRLGILNRDEGYLAFLIRNGLKAYQAKEIDKVSVKSTQV